MDWASAADTTKCARERCVCARRQNCRREKRDDSSSITRHRTFADAECRRHQHANARNAIRAKSKAQKSKASKIQGVQNPRRPKSKASKIQGVQKGRKNSRRPKLEGAAPSKKHTASLRRDLQP